MINVLYICVDWYQVAGSTASLVNLMHALRGQVRPIVLIHKEGKVKKYLESLGYECIISPFFYMWERRKSLKTIIHHPSKIRLYRYWKENRHCVQDVCRQLVERGIHIDIVHTNSSVTTVGIGLAKALHAKHVWHVRECDVVYHKSCPFLGRKILRQLILQADAIICITEAVKNHWELASQRTTVLWNAILTFTNKCESIAFQRDKKFLFVAASLSKLKGVDIAIDAFVKSGLAQDGFVLQLIGNEVADTFNNELLERNGIQMLGYKDNVTSYFQQAKAFLMCSPNEGLGRVTVEAMAYGCLVLGRNTGGTKELIKDGETGYLFDTEEDLVRLMRSVAYEDISTITSKACDFVMQHFTEEIYADKIMKIYNQLLSI